MPPDVQLNAMRGEPSEGTRGASGLHGRRRGKPLGAHQRRLIETVLPRLAIDVSTSVDPAGLFPRRPQEIWMEVGFGSGEHLIAAATQNPEVGMIGCEPYENGMARALSRITALALDNVRLHCGDARDLIDALPDGALGRALIFYPDPWPKRRQRKRRVISESTLERLARVMRSDAQLRFVTDIDDYSGWTLVRLAQSQDFEWTAERAADWQLPWSAWVETRYEAKTKKQGRRPCYITARRLALPSRSA